MLLWLKARPTVVAHEKSAISKKGNALRTWEWIIDDGELRALRRMVEDGVAGTAQRRNDDGSMVMVAWDVAQQRALALQRARERKALADANKQLAVQTSWPRVYLPAAKPVGMQTHAPYMHEPARW